MGRYDENDFNGGSMGRQRDLVLAMNEFCFLQNKTNGAIKTYTGPTTMTISQQESLVVFNPRTKQFEETADFNKAKQLFISAPEGWYIVLKNPEGNNEHPDAGKASNSPSLCIGQKINIAGPCSFSLYPGQMAKTIRGHRLRSNQYLLARVYDAEAAERGMSSATIIDAEGKEKKVENSEKFFVGQLLVIKGTEVSFYMPPTGIEVIPIKDHGTEYVRDAITLERLEYAILKDEDGEKRYVHGPAVVFPKPTETFVTAPKGGTIFRALELSPISGIYVKVIADYVENGVKHPTGEELFITGNDQMIYYPRPEHAMIQYDGKYMHHAIAIPEGEGRYILNRLTGEIKTVKGPQMYLPDPRTEVVVKRKLTAKECQLFYPGNQEVLRYNEDLSEKLTEKMARKGMANTTDILNGAYATSNQEATLAIFEANANISRGVSYTKPRTITLDTKYEGVVAINVWTGYAINVVSKTGTREVVLGPATRLLDYEETLEYMELSTGAPKNENKLVNTAYLRVKNNKVSDFITVQTKDFVDVSIRVSYSVDFLPEFKDNWFSVENYVKFLCDKQRSLLKQKAKQYNIEDFYANVTEIVRKTALNLPSEDEERGESKYEGGRLFRENGMFVHDVEVLGIGVEAGIARILERQRTEMVTKALELSDAEKKMEVVTQLAEYEKKEIELTHKNNLYKMELEQTLAKTKLDAEAEINKKKRVEAEAKKQAEADMQKLLDQIQAAELARDKKHDEAKIETEKELAAIEKAKQEAYAATVAKIMESVSPQLVAAMTSKANADTLTAVSQGMSPYAIANGESIADTVNKLLRGTTLEGVLENLNEYKIAE